MKQRYKIIIQIDHPLVKLTLCKKGKRIDEMEWEEENNLSQKLLLKIDELLKRNDLERENLEEIKTESSHSSYSASRIASITAKVSNFYLTNFEN